MTWLMKSIKMVVSMLERRDMDRDMGKGSSLMKMGQPMMDNGRRTKSMVEALSIYLTTK